MSNRATTLYRSILKTHRAKLPPHLRALGDSYVRNEFNLHKKVTVKENLDIFYDAWGKYLIMLQSRTEKFGENMSDKERTVLSDDQQGKLQELRVEVDKIKEPI